MTPGPPRPSRSRAPGRLSLRLDSIYCAVAAVLLVVFADPVSERLATPPAVTLAIAAGVGGWAAALRRPAPTA